MELDSVVEENMHVENWKLVSTIAMKDTAERQVVTCDMR
jgi:hypothetical protein